MGGGGVEVSIASCSGSGVAAGGGLGVDFGGSDGFDFGGGLSTGLDSGCSGCFGCGCDPCVCNEKSCVSRSRSGKSFPFWLGNGRSPLGAASLPAREFAFDSKVYSFGFSADSFDLSVSTNCGFFSTGGRAGDKSMIVNSDGASSGGIAGVETLPKAAREKPTAR